MEFSKYPEVEESLNDYHSYTNTDLTKTMVCTALVKAYKEHMLPHFAAIQYAAKTELAEHETTCNLTMGERNRLSEALAAVFCNIIGQEVPKSCSQRTWVDRTKQNGTERRR